MKLLIADDEKIIREGLLKLDWKSIGITDIKIADNGMEALEIINKNNPQIILADIKMPGLTGIELAKEIVNKNCKIILLTGYRTFSYAQAAVHFAVFDYLLKPSSPEEILNAVSRCIDSIVIKDESDMDFEIEYNHCNKDMDKIMDYLYKNYMDDVSLTTISDYVHLSPSYISKIIKKETGYNYTKILSSIRMVKAAELLRNTELKVYMICQKVGVKDQRYFSQQFIKIYGKTPMEYRKKYQSNAKKGMIDIIKRI